MRRTNAVWSLLSVIFVLFLLALICLTTNVVYEVEASQKQILRTSLLSQLAGSSEADAAIQTESFAYPLRLRIPKLKVDAPVDYVGLTTTGEMGVPDNTTDVGWFVLGTRPGETGSAVMDGHFNGKWGQPGVFAKLNDLETGDKLYVDYTNGRTIAFAVRESRAFDPGHADDVFNLTDSPHLNLVTCDGYWNTVKKTYSKRLVVFADVAR